MRAQDPTKIETEYASAEPKEKVGYMPDIFKHVILMLSFLYLQVDNTFRRTLLEVSVSDEKAGQVREKSAKYSSSSSPSSSPRSSPQQ